MLERDQEAKADANKLMMELIPPEAFEALAEVLTYGANKYKPESWRTVQIDRYIGAMLRHYTEYRKDPLSVDKESGILHIKHLYCNAMFLCCFAMKELEKN